MCGGSCVEVTGNRDHCGSCFASCGADEECRAGACRPTPGSGQCLPNETRCSGWGCVDLQTNPITCGDCYRSCINGERCAGGVCQIGTCANGGIPCPLEGGGASCILDFSNNVSHCGSCGTQCGPYESCEGGRCLEPTCYDNASYCRESGCVDLTQDYYNCGTCGRPCGSESVFDTSPYTCRGGTCSCSALASPCGEACAVRFSYCSRPVPGGELSTCNELARNAYDRCACRHCLDLVVTCAKTPACINAMDCSLSGVCVDCEPSFYSCTDQNGFVDADADNLVACLNTYCQAP